MRPWNFFAKRTPLFPFGKDRSERGDGHRDASMPWRGSVSLANSHLDGLSIGCIHAGRDAAETDDTPKGFRLELQEQRKSLGRYKRPTHFNGMRRVLPAHLHRHRLTDN